MDIVKARRSGRARRKSEQAWTRRALFLFVPFAIFVLLS